MTTLVEAAQQALEALEANRANWAEKTAAITVLRTALSEPEQKTVPLAEYERLQRLVASQGIRLMEYESEPVQEPVAWMCADEGLAQKGYSRFSRTKEGAWNIPVYTHPADDTALLRQALEALCELEHDTFHPAKVFKHKPAITALRERLGEKT